ncbi:hypothetical protein IEI94_09845 [Halomonas sp. ML-15]|uniref:hypothetical protein n=1 Tax=Halomonas sp. ML-15 TaxID=2773305 RepID=UPI001745DEE1|nr:hypothetical protein [Halomonas sp. ML-15]MBD3896151.1 hypothetical protein [Halomonas sp. ML-15]
MTPDDYKRVVEQLQGMIKETQLMIDRFEATGMDTQMPGDYNALLSILDDAVKQQRANTMAMLR